MSGLLSKHLFVPKDGPGGPVEAHQTKRSASIGSGRYEHAIVENDRRRPALARDGRLPRYVRCSAPLDRDAPFLRYTLAGRPSETGPVLSR